MIDIKNPELLRYVRSELRPARVAVIMGGTLAGALLMALFISANTHTSHYTQGYWQAVYGAIFTASSMILVLWSLLNASQAVVSERTHRTFDFWRTTRLSPMTLAIGKLFGAPIGAWLQFATVLPVALVLGAMGGFRITVIVGSFFIVALCNVTLSAVALCLSMRAQDSRRATMVMLMMAVGLIPSLTSMRTYYGPGESIGLSAWTALNPIAAIVGWHEGAIVKVMLFGRAVPSLLVTVILCAVVIAWSLTALVRSIKLEPEQNSLFSPVQVVGISVCAFLYSYAAYRPWAMIATPNGFEEHGSFETLLVIGIVTTLICLYFTVVSTLLSRDNLRHKMRVSQPQQIATRLIAPWLATSVIGLLAAVWALSAYRSQFAGETLQWSGIVGMYLAMAAYAVRDGMFLQWMVAQRVKAPVLKGSVLLACYYAGCGVLSAVIVGPEHMGQMLRWLVPFSSNPADPAAQPVWLTLMLLVPPIATAALLASGVFRKMQRTGRVLASPVNA